MDSPLPAYARTSFAGMTALDRASNSSHLIPAQAGIQPSRRKTRVLTQTLKPGLISLTLPAGLKPRPFGTLFLLLLGAVALFPVGVPFLGLECGDSATGNINLYLTSDLKLHHAFPKPNDGAVDSTGGDHSIPTLEAGEHFLRFLPLPLLGNDEQKIEHREYQQNGQHLH